MINNYIIEKTLNNLTNIDVRTLETFDKLRYNYYISQNIYIEGVKYSTRIDWYKANKRGRINNS